MRALKTQPREGTIFAGDIIAAYKEAFNMSWWQLLLSTLNGTFKMADPYYQEVDEEILAEILEKDLTDRVIYILHDRDCDDSTFELMGAFHKDSRACTYPIFITWVEWVQDGQRYGHAVISYYHKGVVYIIEPQSDRVFLPPSHWRLTVLMG